MKISAPATSTTCVDYEMNCQIALEEGFLALARGAEAAGWDSDTVKVVLVELALSHLGEHRAITSLAPGRFPAHRN